MRGDLAVAHVRDAVAAPCNISSGLLWILNGQGIPFAGVFPGRQLHPETSLEPTNTGSERRLFLPIPRIAPFVENANQQWILTTYWNVLACPCVEAALKMSMGHAALKAKQHANYWLPGTRQ
jgi:hypothetical protein